MNKLIKIILAFIMLFIVIIIAVVVLFDNFPNYFTAAVTGGVPGGSSDYYCVDNKCDIASSGIPCPSGSNYGDYCCPPDSVVATKYDGYKSCCHTSGKEPHWSKIGLLYQEGKEKCCPANTTGYYHPYTLNPGSENPHTIIIPDCCPMVKSSTNITGYQSQVCGTGDNQTCCSAGQTCRNGKCTFQNDCCMCVYNDAEGSTCAKIKSTDNNWIKAENICVGCLYFRLVDVSPYILPPPTSAQQACEALIKDTGKLCSWDKIAGCVSWFHKNCIDEKNKSSVANNCDSFPLIVDPDDGPQKVKIVNNYLLDRKCTSLKYFEAEHGDSTNSIFTYTDVILTCINNVKGNCDFVKNSCLTAQNKSSVALLDTCVQQTLLSKGDFTSIVTVTMEQAVSGESNKSTQVDFIGANFIIHNYIACSKIGIGTKNECLKHTTLHRALCQDDGTGNIVNMQCCPLRKSALKIYSNYWVRMNNEDSKCPNTKITSGTAKGCEDALKKDYITEAFNKYNNAYQDAVNNCDPKIEFIRTDAKAYYIIGSKIYKSLRDIPIPLPAGTQFCVSSDWTCVQDSE